jgi:hypothetical protein
MVVTLLLLVYVGLGHGLQSLPGYVGPDVHLKVLFHQRADSAIAFFDRSKRFFSHSARFFDCSKKNNSHSKSNCRIGSFALL